MERLEFISEIKKFVQHFYTQIYKSIQTTDILECLLAGRHLSLNTEQNKSFVDENQLDAIVHDKILSTLHTHLNYRIFNSQDSATLLEVLTCETALRSLSFGWYNVVVNDFSNSIFETLAYNSNLAELRLRPRCPYEALLTLNSALKHNQYLSYIELLPEESDPYSEIRLDFLHFNQHLTSLRLSSSNIQIIVQICASLQFNSSLKSLFLSTNNNFGNQIPSHDTHIFENLFAYSNLEIFNLSGINLGRLNSESTWGLDFNQSLQSFTLTHCTHQGVNGLMHALRFNHTLTFLSVPDIGIKTFASELAESLTLNQTLKHLNICDYYLSYRPAQPYRKIYQALCYNAHLESLHLSCSDIDQETALDIGLMLSHQPSLRALKIYAYTKYHREIIDSLAYNNILNKIEVNLGQVKNFDEFKKWSEPIFARNTALTDFDFHNYANYLTACLNRNRNICSFLKLRTIAAAAYFKDHHTNLLLETSELESKIPKECISELKSVQKKIDSIFTRNR